MGLRSRATWRERPSQPRRTRALRTLDPEDAHGWAIRGLEAGVGPGGRARRPDLVGKPRGPAQSPTSWAWPLRHGVRQGRRGVRPHAARRLRLLSNARHGHVPGRRLRQSAAQALPGSAKTARSSNSNGVRATTRDLEAFAGRIGPPRAGRCRGQHRGQQGLRGSHRVDYVTGLRRLWGPRELFHGQHLLAPTRAARPASAADQAGAGGTAGTSRRGSRRAAGGRARPDVPEGRARPGSGRGGEHRRDLLRPWPRPG